MFKSEASLESYYQRLNWVRNRSIDSQDEYKGNELIEDGILDKEMDRFDTKPAIQELDFKIRILRDRCREKLLKERLKKNKTYLMENDSSSGAFKTCKFICNQKQQVREVYLTNKTKSDMLIYHQFISDEEKAFYLRTTEVKKTHPVLTDQFNSKFVNNIYYDETCIIAEGGTCLLSNWFLNPTDTNGEALPAKFLRSTTNNSSKKLYQLTEKEHRDCYVKQLIESMHFFYQCALMSILLNIILCDVKPQNAILIPNESGKGCKLKLIDKEIAKLKKDLNSHRSSIQLTERYLSKSLYKDVNNAATHSEYVLRMLIDNVQCTLDQMLDYAKHFQLDNKVQSEYTYLSKQMKEMGKLHAQVKNNNKIVDKRTKFEADIEIQTQQYIDRMADCHMKSGFESMLDDSGRFQRKKKLSDEYNNTSIEDNAANLSVLMNNNAKDIKKKFVDDVGYLREKIRNIKFISISSVNGTVSSNGASSGIRNAGPKKTKGNILLMLLPCLWHVADLILTYHGQLYLDEHVIIGQIIESIGKVVKTMISDDKLWKTVKNFVSETVDTIGLSDNNSRKSHTDQLNELYENNLCRPVFDFIKKNTKTDRELIYRRKEYQLMRAIDNVIREFKDFGDKFKKERIDGSKQGIECFYRWNHNKKRNRISCLQFWSSDKSTDNEQLPSCFLVLLNMLYKASALFKMLQKSSRSRKFFAGYEEVLKNIIHDWSGILIKLKELQDQPLFSSYDGYPLLFEFRDSCLNFINSDEKKLKCTYNQLVKAIGIKSQDKILFTQQTLFGKNNIKNANAIERRLFEDQFNIELDKSINAHGRKFKPSEISAQWDESVNIDQGDVNQPVTKSLK